MSSYQFFHPIEIRYGDLDPQGHVNNAKYLTYMEQARIQYIKNLGLWKSNSFLDVGIILAEVRVTYRIPIQYGTEIKVGVRVSRLG
ncbi:MAG: acyl-CoA thioesterase, partial [Anaerolineales bacterium]